MGNVLVSVILVNYNTYQLTKDCIDSIFLRTKDISFEVILVDNASIDGSKEYFTSDSRIIYIYNNENLGFGSANNIGARRAGGKYLFFLNSDTILNNNVILQFYEIAEKKDDNLGFIGCELIDKDGIVNGYGSSFPTIKDELRTAFHIKIQKNKRRYNFNNKCYPIDYVLGADMFVRKKLFDRLGGFDEHFFMYYEESDLQKRSVELGYENFIVDGPSITHLEGKSTGTASIKKRMMVDRSKFYYFKKHYSKSYPLFRLLYALSRTVILFSLSLSNKDKILYIRFIFSI